jgi:hypothetical protein
LGHDGVYENNHFLEQKRRMMMIITSTPTDNKTIKVKRPKDGEFHVIFFGFCFVVRHFFFFYVFVEPKKI